MIKKEMIIADILDIDSGSSSVFIENGMHCIGCPSARGESVEDACLVHGINPQKLVDSLNEYFDKTAV